MRATVFSAVAICVIFSGCSSDDSPSVAGGGSTQTSINDNNPAGSAGGSVGTGGSAGAGGAVTGAGGTEGAPDNVGIGQGGASGAATGAAGSSMAAAAGASGAAPTADAGADDTTMSFFVTSRGAGNGGNFGGIAGADEFCRTLAAESSPALGAKTWRAYLSTSTENARDRIGDGPWRNFAGRIIANDVDQLHDQAANGSLNATWPLADVTVPLDEQGDQVPSAQPNVLHDIITGTNLDGTVAASGTCSDWTSTTGTTQNGHSNRAGGGANPSSWNGAHGTGCGEPTANFQQGTVSQGGGRGSIYCFATD